MFDPACFQVLWVNFMPNFPLKIKAVFEFFHTPMSRPTIYSHIPTLDLIEDAKLITDLSIGDHVIWVHSLFLQFEQTSVVKSTKVYWQYPNIEKWEHSISCTSGLGKLL